MIYDHNYHCAYICTRTSVLFSKAFVSIGAHSLLNLTQPAQQLRSNLVNVQRWSNMHDVYVCILVGKVFL